MEPTDQTAPPAPADAAQPAENASATVTSGAGHAEPVVDESATQPQATDAVLTPAPADAAQPAGEPPAQAGDDGETAVAVAKPVLLPSVEEAKAELASNPARTSVLSSSGVVVRE